MYERPEQYDEWAAEVHRIAALHDAGDHAAADAGWVEIIAATGLDLDRSILLINRATTLTELGRLSDAEACLDQAIAIEHRWHRSFAREHAAAWLAARGRTAEAIEAYRGVVHEPWLQLAERRRVAANIAHLESL